MVYGAKRTSVRHYVRVIALHELDGHMVPLQILWDDHRRFDVCVIGHPRRERTKTHGFAIRHDVLIGEQRRILWKDDSGWFVEIMKPIFRNYDMPQDPRLVDVPE